MVKSTLTNCLYAMICAGCLGAATLSATETPPGIIGKNNWLYYRYELSDVADAAATDQTLDLIQRFNRVLASNGITMVIAMVPLKMRIYAENLPDDVKVNPYMEGNYERMRKALRSARVNVVDINTSFLGSDKRLSESPLFYRLDTHWSQTGALVAANAIKRGVDADPILKRVLDATPEVAYKIFFGSKKIPSQAQDLIQQLPPNSRTFQPEQVIPFSVSRTQTSKDALLGNRRPDGIVLLGSSYSREWTGFPDALRHALQRNILSIGVSASEGSWVGMESYLRDDSFQSARPKLLIWEIPERDMRAPPDYQYREARYTSNNTEWLLRVSAWTQVSCKLSSVVAKMAPIGLAGPVVGSKGLNVGSRPSKEGEFVEINFDRPLNRLDYLAMRVTANGSRSMVFEGSGADTETRRFTLPSAGDDVPHTLKIPLSSRGNGFTKLRIFPGNSSSFSLQNFQLCRLPEDLLR